MDTLFHNKFIIQQHYHQYLYLSQHVPTTIPLSLSFKQAASAPNTSYNGYCTYIVPLLRSGDGREVWGPLETDIFVLIPPYGTVLESNPVKLHSDKRAKSSSISHPHHHNIDCRRASLISVSLLIYFYQ